MDRTEKERIVAIDRKIEGLKESIKDMLALQERMRGVIDAVMASRKRLAKECLAWRAAFGTSPKDPAWASNWVATGSARKDVDDAGDLENPGDAAAIGSPTEMVVADAARLVARKRVEGWDRQDFADALGRLFEGKPDAPAESLEYPDTVPTEPGDFPQAVLSRPMPSSLWPARLQGMQATLLMSGAARQRPEGSWDAKIVLTILAKGGTLDIVMDRQSALSASRLLEQTVLCMDKETDGGSHDAPAT